MEKSLFPIWDQFSRYLRLPFKLIESVLNFGGFKDTDWIVSEERGRRVSVRTLIVFSVNM
jgi:hypothetical protein